MQITVKIINRIAKDFEDIKNKDGPIPIYLDIGEVFFEHLFIGTRSPNSSHILKGTSLTPFP